MANDIEPFFIFIDNIDTVKCLFIYFAKCPVFSQRYVGAFWYFGHKFFAKYVL